MALGHFNQPLIDRVQQNCNLSDALYAGNYSMCIFLLKMREYYRWENNLSFSHKLPLNDVGDWLVKREHHWSQIEKDSFQHLPLSKTFDPFDADNINSDLINDGYVYSSGIGIFGKPHFFIGKLLDTKEFNGMKIFISGKEFARDLVAPPAMSLNNNIFIRQESVRRYIWEKVEEWRLNKNKAGPMKNVLAHWPDLNNIEPILDSLVEIETETMILHEVGEIQAGHELGKQWKQMMLEMSGTKAEFFLRAVRDILADCLVTLPSLLENDNNMSIHFYFANFSGLRKHLFPELRHSYEEWCKNKKTCTISTSINKNIERWHKIAVQSLKNYKANGRKANIDIELQMSQLIPSS